MFVSVIVPVYKSLPDLKGCLEALDVQSYPDYEIIVIDNGENDGIEAVCKKYAKVLLLKHEIPGSYSSRNAGIKAAGGEWIFLTDADCIPDKDWIKNALTRLTSHSCKMGSGRIRPAFRKKDRPSIIELCDVILHTMDQQQTLAECTSVACANMLVHRTLFDSVGLFNDTLFSAGDCEFTFRVKKSGEKILFINDAVVFHYARKSLKELSQRYRRFAGAEFESMTTKNKISTVRELRSLNFSYRILLCLNNMHNGIIKYKRYKNPVVLAFALFLVESYITVIKFLEYVRLSLGAEKQR